MTRDGCSLGRQTAFKIREQVERGRRLDRALGSCIQGVEARERAFAHELSYGVTRLQGRLDHLLSPHVHRGVDTLDPNVREVLRLAAYQLLYMHSVPD
ncbi:MAG: transcription antitermination factor NusB, partial [Gemmatimonadota bacterium]|nr:transcription antitermination factor NusB [Gemmatimonadota bacterium]